MTVELLLPCFAFLGIIWGFQPVHVEPQNDPALRHHPVIEEEAQ